LYIYFSSSPTSLVDCGVSYLRISYYLFYSVALSVLTCSSG
jgi:hypothetical protein